MDRVTDVRAALRNSVIASEGLPGAEAVPPCVLWAAVLEGRACIVDRFQQGPFRYLLVSPLRADRANGAALTGRQMEALRAVMDGVDERQLARRLGVSATTVAAHRGRALSKVGIGIHEIGCSGAHARWLRVGADRWGVVVLPALSDLLPDTLSAAEREVAALVLDGHSNAEIAERRGRSLRTIANQVAAVFRKAGVSGRGELLALLSAGVDRHRAPRSGPSAAGE